MTTENYNGWTNRSSRLAGLRIGSDQGLYLEAREAEDISELQDILQNHFDYTKENNIAGLGTEQFFDWDAIDWQEVWESVQDE